MTGAEVKQELLRHHILKALKNKDRWKAELVTKLAKQFDVSEYRINVAMAHIPEVLTYKVGVAQESELAVTTRWHKTPNFPKQRYDT